jgi:hypothetical protein
MAVWRRYWLGAAPILSAGWWTERTGQDVPELDSVRHMQKAGPQRGATRREPSGSPAQEGLPVSREYEDTPSGRYRREADRLDAAFDAQLADLRQREEAGEIDPLAGARERIRLMEEHLAALRAAFQLHYGTGEGSSSERPR